MKIASIKETKDGELRSSITPDSAKFLIQNNFEVTIEKNIGNNANFIDDQYKQVGAKLSSIPLEILSDADIILKVNPAGINEKFTEAEFAKEGSVIISFFKPHESEDLIKFYAEKKISLLAMELVPRSSVAQSFDALSSQANLIGYQSVIEAANLFTSAFPMLMTAAGTIKPAKILVLGAGVAGLQAIATAKRLGATVSAYDVRADAKEQVQSLGAKFIHPDISKDFSASGGYAKEVDDDFARRQEEMLENEISKFDIVITTAQIPGRKAPTLITRKMVNNMNAGSVIVDIAASSGGNCELTTPGKVTSVNNVNIIGYNNFASRIATSASFVYSKNLSNLITYLFKDKKELDINNEITKAMLLTHDGKIFYKKK